MKHLHPWLIRVVQFEDWDAPWAPDLWKLLQVDSEYLEQIIDLMLRWENGVLKVSVRFRDRADVHEQITIILLRVWTFSSFSDSRWITLGCCMRTLLCSILLGPVNFVGVLGSYSECREFNSRLVQACTCANQNVSIHVDLTLCEFMLLLHDLFRSTSPTHPHSYPQLRSVWCLLMRASCLQGTVQEIVTAWFVLNGYAVERY